MAFWDRFRRKDKRKKKDVSERKIVPPEGTSEEHKEAIEQSVGFSSDDATVPPSGPWRSRPIFITSTFRDMQAERDYLRDKVFPVLEERLRARRHHLEPIDLRWGVETVSVDEQHAKELLVLKVCLAEIQRSRPFLIALLGDRYGWVPPAERMEAATQEASYVNQVKGKSVTALEIEYGVLDHANQQRRSRFYFREPLPYDRMNPETAAAFSEAHDTHPGAKKAAQRLEALKVRIKNSMPADRVRSYAAQWDEKNGRVTGLEAWGEQALEDLWCDLEEETRAFAQTPASSPLEQERRALAEFVEMRNYGYVPRGEITKKLLDLAGSRLDRKRPWGASVVGEPGSGKSALFAHLYRRLKKKDVLVLGHAAGISPLSGRVESMLRRWIEELKAFLKVQSSLAGDAGMDEVKEIFRSLLHRSRKEKAGRAFGGRLKSVRAHASKPVRHLVA